MRVLVAGDGIIGRTTAVALREAGHDVELRYDPGRSPSSLASCALVLPYFGTSRTTDAVRWARTSWQRFDSLSKVEASGVRPMRMVEMFRQQQQPDPVLESVTSVEHGERSDLPSPYRYAWDFVTWLVETPIYYDHLARELGALGVARVPSPLNLSDGAPRPGRGAVVIDCTGHWSASGSGVRDVVPVRGQCVVLRGDGLNVALGGDEFIVAQRSDGVLVGSLWQEGNEDSDSSQSDTESLIATLVAWKRAPILNSLRVDPTHATAAVLAGVRPFREKGPLVEASAGRPWLVHNVGHGGSGVALSWGTAAAVEEILAGSGERDGVARGVARTKRVAGRRHP